jgi:hypothetical protein
MHLVFCIIQDTISFYRKCRINNRRDTYKAASCIGRQPESNTWVLGKHIEITGDGNLVDPENTSFVFIKSLLDSEASCHVTLPLSSLTLGEVVQSLMSTLHHNGMAGIFTIGIIFIRIFPTHYSIS